MMLAYETETDYELNINKRTIPYGKNKIILDREDPYGFFVIKLEKGRVPSELAGFYTDAKSAEIAINQFLNKKGLIPDSA